MKTDNPTDSVKRMIGETFGNLVVVSFLRWKEFDCGKRHPIVKCICGCGEVLELDARWVRAPCSYIKSCGCLARSRCRVRMTKHGHSVGSPSKTYNVWSSAIGRCENPKDKGFKDYGDRGIKMCSRWRHSFSEFVTDMGDKPEGMSIERINNDIGYTCGKCEDCKSHNWPSNCKWATRLEQNRNTRRNRYVTLNGQRMVATQAAKIIGLKLGTLLVRLKNGWSEERALSTPLQCK